MGVIRLDAATRNQMQQSQGDDEFILDRGVIIARFRDIVV